MQTTKILNANVIVAALGYFVDIYDLLLFGIVRVQSLRGIGVAEELILEKGVLLINCQMIGMLLGGIIWGVLGDKRGRVSVLFGSIALYSLANIANAFVTNVEMYALLRFVAGVGLAGELGAAITLVSETMSKETRGYGATVVAAVGILGAVVGALVGDAFSWQTAYIIGGLMGLALLFLRVSMFESGMFAEVKKSSKKRGDFFMLFTSRARFLKYARCILIGLPIWYAVGIWMTFSPELAAALGVVGDVSAGKAIMWGYIGLAAGDLSSGWLSQIFKSRRKIVYAFLTGTLLLTFAFYLSKGVEPNFYYTLCTIMGFFIGYWAVFMIIASEQFGTNVRATVTTTVPNFVRGGVVPITLAFQALTQSMGIRMSALVVGIVVLAIAYISLYFMEETYAKDLNYLEE